MRPDERPLAILKARRRARPSASYIDGADATAKLGLTGTGLVLSSGCHFNRDLRGGEESSAWKYANGKLIDKG